MKQRNQSITPVCEINIVNPGNVQKALTHIDQYEEITDLSELFKVLGDNTRLKIILALMNNELCVCDLASLLNMTMSAVSHQLRLLKNARLVKFRREGKMIFYSLQDEHIRQLVQIADIHRREQDY